MKPLLDPTENLTLRPIRYPQFWEAYERSKAGGWEVDRIDLSRDLVSLQQLTPGERHMIGRLVAFFATGDTFVANNLALNLYKHINAPEARMFLARQLAEEALHVEFYLKLLDVYLPDEAARTEAFNAVENIGSIAAKAAFCRKWIGSIDDLGELQTLEDRRKFLLNLVCFSACIEGLFFFGAFAYVFFLRSKGLLPGLGDGTEWIFKDETRHMEFAFDVIQTAVAQEPELVDATMRSRITEMIQEAVVCETMFAFDALSEGVSGLPVEHIVGYLEHVGDYRLQQFGCAPIWGTKNPLLFMDQQALTSTTKFFERGSDAYTVAGHGDLSTNFQAAGF